MIGRRCARCGQSRTYEHTCPTRVAYGPVADAVRRFAVGLLMALPPEPLDVVRHRRALVVAEDVADDDVPPPRLVRGVQRWTGAA